MSQFLFKCKNILHIRHDVNINKRNINSLCERPEYFQN